MITRRFKALGFNAPCFKALGFKALALAASAIAFEAAPATADVRMYEVIKDATTIGDVVSNGLGPQGQRYSPLKQLNRENLAALTPAWTLPLGVDGQTVEPSQPLVRDGLMFVRGPGSRIVAIDIKSGRPRWRHEPTPAEPAPPCCETVDRSMALIADKLVFASRTGTLVALNARSGQVVWSREVDAGQAPAQRATAPIVVPSKVHGALIVLGVGGADGTSAGRFEARKYLTGDLVWSRSVAESPVVAANDAAPAGQGVPDALSSATGAPLRGGAPALPATYDPDTNLILVGTGRPTRSDASPPPSGNSRWSSSRLALAPETGAVKWAFQTTPDIGVGYDGVNEVVAFDLDGTKAAATADRNGFFYVLNRANGKLIAAYPFVSRINWAKSLDKSGRPVVDPAVSPQSGVTAATGAPAAHAPLTVPSPLGAKTWMPMAYSRSSGLFYVPTNEWGSEGSHGGGGDRDVSARPRPVFDTHIGALKAIEPATGRVVWEHRSRSPLWGGVLTTAAGLVVFGTTAGELVVLDDQTGKPLRTLETGGGIVGTPITWLQDGEQWIAVITGLEDRYDLAAPSSKASGATVRGAQVIAFRLPKPAIDLNQ